MTETEREHDKVRAEEQVKAFHDLMLREYGISDKDLKETIRFITRLHERELRLRRYGEWAAKAVIVGIAGYLGVAFLKGFLGYIDQLFGLHLRV